MYIFCDVHICFVKSKKITWPVVVIHCSICAEIYLGCLVDFVSADCREHNYSRNAVRFRLHHTFYIFYLHLHLHLGFVHPLQDVALHQCLPLSSVCCFPHPGGSLLVCYVILPSSAWSSSRPLPSPWLPLCALLCPPIVL